MRAVSLLYHDAVPDAARIEESGFPGAGAAPYKLDESDMRAHFDALANDVAQPPALVTDVLDGSIDRTPLLLTFDDGGKSAATVIADMLAKRGWRAHFFVTTDYTGTAPFVNEQEIRSLRGAGHVIGSHSASHPTRMAACSREELLMEWRTSRARLEDILEEPVITASVPGGYFSRMVAETAAESGIRALFNSEPVKRVKRVRGCLVFGRYNLWRGMAPAVSAGLAAERLSGAQVQQYTIWNAKKVVKRMGGERYLAWRRIILDKSRPRP